MIFEILNGETVTNTIVADIEYMLETYTDGNYREIKQPDTAPVDTPKPLPEMVITSVSGGDYSVEDREANIASGSTIKIEAEIHLCGEITSDFDAAIRIPLVSSDRRERVIGASIAGGKVSASWTPLESGVWNIDPVRMNQYLKPDRQLAFSGLRIFVLE